MEFMQDGSPWGTTGRELQNGVSLHYISEDIKTSTTHPTLFKAIPTDMQILHKQINFFTQLLRWILPTVLKTLTVRTPLLLVLESTLNSESSW